MQNYGKVCELLTAAVPMTDVPNYYVKSADVFEDELDLKRKVDYLYKHWISRNQPLRENPPLLSCLGCCEIDHFTGNDMLKIFHNIISKSEYNTPGNLLYLSKKQNYCAAMLFTKFKPLCITPFF